MTNIHPSAVVGENTEFGDDVSVGPNCVIAAGVSIGSGTVLDANVVVERNVRIGKNNRFFPNSVIGAWPQTLGLTNESEIGGVVIGDGNVMHELVTVHSSMHSGQTTRVGNDNFLMVGVHIGHDCDLEDKILMSNAVQLSGHCKIETGVWLSGMVGLHQFVTLGKWCFVAGLAGLTKDVPPFLMISGHYPSVIRGVNKRGMQRGGYSEDEQGRVMSAYKRLYRQGGSLFENALDLAKEDGIDDNVKAITDSIVRSRKHQYGRYLETLREK